MIYALDQIDEIALSGVGRFADKEVVDATKENVKLAEETEEQKVQKEEAGATFKEVTEWLNGVLDKKVDKNKIHIQR